MNKFDKPPEDDDSGEDIWEGFSPEKRAKIEKDLEVLSPQQKREFIEEMRKKRRYDTEVVESEIEEWSGVIERAKTKEEIRYIVRSILTIADLEKTLATSTALSADDPSRRETQYLINRFRSDFGLPPKYS